MENSPLVLAIAQIIVLIGQAVAYLRTKQDLARTRTDMGTLTLDTRTAKDTADGAKRAVESIEISHYQSLRAKYEEVLTDLVAARSKIAALQGEVESMRESIASLNNKLASRERTDKAAARKAAQEEAQELPTDPGKSGVDDLVRQLGIPLAGNNAVPAAGGRPAGFGRSAR